MDVFTGEERLINVNLSAVDRLEELRDIRKRLEQLLEDELQPISNAAGGIRLGCLTFQGQVCDDRTELDYYLPHRQTVVFSMKGFIEPPGGFPVFVRGLEGRTITLYPHSSHTVEVLKRQLQCITGIPYSDQRLTTTFQFENHCTLEKYKIRAHASVDLCLRLRGGCQSFADISNQGSLINKSWSLFAPKWRMVEYGPCLEGKCRNRQCKAYKKMVISNQRFGTFDLLLDSNKCKCPICYQPFNPVTCAFNNCVWRYLGVKLGTAGDPVQVKGDWKEAGDQYERFDDSANTQASWTRLLISTRPIPTNRTAAKEASSVASDCVICLEPMPSNAMEPLTTTPCKHIFHKACISLWQLKNPSCPCCRTTLNTAEQGKSDCPMPVRSRPYLDRSSKRRRLD